MADSVRKRAEELFQQVVDLPPDERPAFLDARCDDPGVREEVELLLEYEHRGLEGFLEAALPAAPGESAPGERIGPYELLREIGAGGFGVVYLGEQKEPFQRRVAVKVLKLGMDSRRIVARFEAERQTLAMVEHPNVAKVLDAGTTPHGRPYFVMEYVPGSAITQHADERRLNVAGRLLLFLQVCEAIQHAHQKGVIHRDLKPSNVLVQDVGGRPLVKVIDFGIAKLIGGESAAAMMTQAGEIMGTPEYMAPEQAELSEGNVDTRTDIYQLGVLLYEMLVGALPFDPQELRRAGLSEALRRIREEEPLRPSTRLRGLAEGLKTVTWQRRSDPLSLRSELEGDLDWIAMKAMAKEPMRRYASASELAADIVRHLQHEPVLAGPPGASYRIRKFVRRHRGAVIAGSAVALAVLLGLAAATAGFIEATFAKRELIKQEDAAQRLAYRATISAATALLQTHQVAAARRSLELVPEPRRRWEWRYLYWLSDPSLVTLTGHQGGVTSAAPSADGRSIISCGADGTVRVWDASTGALLSTVRAHNDGASGVLSPDAEKLLTRGSRDIALWAWREGKELWRLPLEATIHTLAFHPDGRTFAVGLSDGHRCSLRRTESGEEVSSFPIAEPVPFEVGHGPDGEVIAFGGYRWVERFDPASGRSLWKYSFQPARQAGPVLPVGARLIPASRFVEPTILLDAASGQEAGRFSSSTGAPHNSALSPDGLRLASGDSAGTIALWDTLNGVQISALHGHLASIVSLAFSRDGTRLVSASRDGTVKLWDAFTDASFAVKHRVAPLGDTYAIAISPDWRQGVSVGWGSVTLWDIASGAERWSRVLGRKILGAVAFSPDGQHIAAAGEDRQVHVLDLQGRSVSTGRLLESRVHALAWMPRGVAAGCDDGSILVLDPVLGHNLLTLTGHSSPVRCLTLSADGTRLASGSGDEASSGNEDESAPPGKRDRSVRLWDAGSGRQILLLAGHTGPVICVAFSPDARRVASGSTGGEIVLWDVERGERLFSLAGAEGRVRCTGFSRDGVLLAAADASTSLHIWDTGTGEEVASLPSLSLLSCKLDFSPDDRTVLLGGRGSIDFALFESGPPACGFQDRYRVRTAKGIVDRLFLELRLSADIAERVEGDTELPEDLRRTAAEIARARGDSLNYNNSHAWEIVRAGGRSSEEYRLAVREVELCLKKWPDSYDFLNTLGVGQYRVGDYRAAVATLSRCDAIFREQFGGSHPVDLAVRAMAHEHLGETASARADLDRARALLRDPRYQNDIEHTSFVREAEALVDGKHPE